MNGSLKLRKLAVGAAMLALFAMPMSAAAQEAAATEVSGAAFGISADGTVMIEPTPSVVLPAEGGTVEDEVLELNESGVTTGVISVMTMGDLEAGTASSTATVDTLAIGTDLPGLADILTATTIEATSDSVCNAEGMAESVGDVVIEDLNVLGTPVEVTGEPNQEVTVDVPEVGSIEVIINEQIGGDGDLTVNALRVTVTTALGEEQEFVVASAHSDIVCAAVAGDDQQDDQQDDTAGEDKQDDTAGDDQQDDKQDDGAGDDQQGELPKTGGAPVSALYSVITLGGAAFAGLGAYAVRRRQ